MCGPHDTEIEKSHFEVERSELLDLQRGWFRMMGTGLEEPLVFLACGLSCLQEKGVELHLETSSKQIQM